MDSVYLLIMDVEGALGELLLAGVKALQVALIIPNKPVTVSCPTVTNSTLTHNSAKPRTQTILDKFHKVCPCVSAVICWWCSATA